MPKCFVKRKMKFNKLIIIYCYWIPFCYIETCTQSILFIIIWIFILFSHKSLNKVMNNILGKFVMEWETIMQTKFFKLNWVNSIDVIKWYSTIWSFIFHYFYTMFWIFSVTGFEESQGTCLDSSQKICSRSSNFFIRVISRCML